MHKWRLEDEKLIAAFRGVTAAGCVPQHSCGGQRCRLLPARGPPLTGPRAVNPPHTHLLRVPVEIKLQEGIIHHVVVVHKHPAPGSHLFVIFLKGFSPLFCPPNKSTTDSLAPARPPAHPPTHPPTHSPIHPPT